MLRKVTLALVPPLRSAPWRWPPAPLRRAACSGRSTRIITTTTRPRPWLWHRFVGGGYGDCYVTRRVLTPHGFRWRTVNVCY